MACVPKDVSFFNSHGMDGWFQQTYKLVGTLTLDGYPIALRAMMLWDSHPEGRLGHIIQSAPKTQQYFWRKYFLNIPPLKCRIAETGAAVAVDYVPAAVLFTRYMDNTYLGICNVPESLLPAVRHFVEIFQHILYEVPFRWEPESQLLNWGECSVMCTDTPSPSMKGEPPVEPFFNPEMWDRWPGRWLPNCPLVLQSMFPAGLVPYAVHERVPSANAYRLVLIPHSTCGIEMVPQTGTALQHARTLDGKLPDELKYCEKHAAGSKVYYRCW